MIQSNPKYYKYFPSRTILKNSRQFSQKKYLIAVNRDRGYRPERSFEKITRRLIGGGICGSITAGFGGINFSAGGNFVIGK